MEERHVPLSTVAGRLGVSERTVRRWIQAGKLKATRPGRDYRIPESAVKALVEEGEVTPKAQSPLPLEEFAAGPALLGKVLDAARQDAKKNAQAKNRAFSSEGTSEEIISGFAEDKVRAELRSLGFPDVFFEGLLWPLVERVTELERQVETRGRQPEDRRSATLT